MTLRDVEDRILSIDFACIYLEATLFELDILFSHL